MVTINRATFINNLYETVFDLLTANLVSSTPVGGFTEELQTLPATVVGRPNTTTPELVLSRDLKEFEVVMILTVQAIKNKDVDTAADELRELFLQNENTFFFDTHNLFDMEILQEDGGEDLIQGKQIHSSVLTITWKTEFRVT